MNKITTRINEKWLDENGILRMKVLEGAYIDLESLTEDSSINMQLTGGKKALVLYDARNFCIVTHEAKNYLQSSVLKENRIATAIVTDRLGIRLLVNFMAKVKPSISPTKMFKDEESALDWLHRQPSI